MVPAWTPSFAIEELLFLAWWGRRAIFFQKEPCFRSRMKRIHDGHIKFTLQTFLWNCNMFCFMFPKLFATGSCARSESQRCSGIPDRAGAATLLSLAGNNTIHKCGAFGEFRG